MGHRCFLVSLLPLSNKDKTCRLCLNDCVYFLCPVFDVVCKLYYLECLAEVVKPFNLFTRISLDLFL